MTPSRSGWLLGLAACAALAALPSCSKKDDAADDDKATASGATPAAAPPAKAPASADMPPAAPAGQARTIEVNVDDKGYHPVAAPARGGEKLVLAFTRTADSECVSQVIVQEKLTDLPMNKRVEIPVTMPADGELVFTCGMKMFEGKVSVVPAK
jgi:hypothetical protein